MVTAGILKTLDVAHNAGNTGALSLALSRLVVSFDNADPFNINSRALELACSGV